MARWLAGSVNALLVAAVALVCGCGGGEARVGQYGLSVKLPQGWKQGEPRASGGYQVTGGGPFFFEDAERDNPSGEVIAYDLMGEGLTEFVDKLVEESEKMEAMHVGLLKAVNKAAGGDDSAVKEVESEVKTRVASKEARTIGGLDAVEVVTEGQRSTVTAYVRKGDKVIAVSFGAAREDFPKYEQAFKEAIGTIRIE